MFREAKKFELICDHCGLTVKTRDDYNLPIGWKKIRTYGWGLTNYSRSEELCPACYEAHKKELP